MELHEHSVVNTMMDQKTGQVHGIEMVIQYWLHRIMLKFEIIPGNKSLFNGGNEK